ncbi:FecR domain-containing protein [Asticcacaulis sp. BYS171W]|uniref:FecR domain-containing protein n=1 Tax=Asticcacaulis aquaticus TaxID=2984212 RepID=A0ABT5HZ65_9CAUL|nr:FecR domain-containing protein [Asticcacaulis aquaticus]MDC7685284.1 FecR domain-containing protein [Asticcacaulis aquaticus]
MTDRNSAADIENAANRWLWLRESGDWTPEQAEALEVWLADSSAHEGAFLRAEAAWATLDRLAWDGAAISNVTRLPSRRRRIIAGLTVAAAAVIAAFVLIPRGERYVSPEMEVRAVALRDGSAATLNTATDLRAEMGDHQRQVRLKSGEAFFRVRHDKARPFVVAAGPLRVRAVGTAFSVAYTNESPRVVVTEGVVEVWSQDHPQQRTRLVAGQVAALSDGVTAVETLTPNDPAERRLAWRQGRIDLGGETLKEAVERFNRYNRVKLVVADTRLNEERLYGGFDMHDPASFARTAGTVLTVPVEASADEIRIGTHTGP